MAKKEGFSSARVTPVMNLLKLPADTTRFLFQLKDPHQVRKYSERMLRKRPFPHKKAETNK
jgi:hypothetical protein